MICSYYFKIDNGMRPAAITEFKVAEYTISFEIKEEKVDQLVLSFKADINELPEFDNTVKPARINFTYPKQNEVKNIVNIVEGLWAIWDVEGIDKNTPTIVWVPEDEEEKGMIKVNSYTHKEADFNNSEQLPFDLIARPIIFAIENMDYDMTFSFYRRAKNELDSENYIDAIYNFYFILETLFGNGKYKSKPVTEEFNKSELLKNAIIKTKGQGGSFVNTMPRQLQRRYLDKYLDYSPEQWIDRIVKIRGKLHHHNHKYQGVWDPEGQHEYHLEAFLLLHVCHNIIYDRYSDCTNTEIITEKIKKILLEKGIDVSGLK